MCSEWAGLPEYEPRASCVRAGGRRKSGPPPQQTGPSGAAGGPAYRWPVSDRGGGLPADRVSR